MMQNQTKNNFTAVTTNGRIVTCNPHPANVSTNTFTFYLLGYLRNAQFANADCAKIFIVLCQGTFLFNYQRVMSLQQQPTNQCGRRQQKQRKTIKCAQISERKQRFQNKNNITLHSLAGVSQNTSRSTCPNICNTCSL